MNRIIFGGAFDPVHNGHINMAEKAAKALDGDVFFLPARISVWKESSAPKEDKIKMLELAIKGHRHFHIDDYELNSGEEINYSIDTIRYMKEKYPKDNIFYLIGADQVNEFHRWKEAEELAKLAKIVLYKRPGHQINEENVKKYQMMPILGDDYDVSSTKIRELKSLELPDEVLFYIVENNLYSGMVELNRILTPHRLSHVKSVAKLAYEIAVSNNLDKPLKYYFAGLLHDLGKDIPLEEQYKIVCEHFSEYKDLPKFAYHQFAGAYLANKMFEVNDKDMLEAIEFHATGNSNMKLMGKIIYAADKIEPTRGFDSSDLIAAMKNNAEEGFKIVLKANKEFLLDHNKSIENELTSKCFKQYL